MGGSNGTKDSRTTFDNRITGNANQNNGINAGEIGVSFLASLIQSLIMQSAASQSRAWTQYQGINLSKPYSINSVADNALVQLGNTMLGPVGGLLGRLVSRFIVPPDVNKLGGIDSPATMLLRTQGGTYGGSFQNLLYASTLSNLKSQRALGQKQLQKLFYKRYLQITQNGKVTEEQVNQLDKMGFSVPAALNAIFDPMNMNGILQGIETAQAGGALWANRANPLKPGEIFKRAKQYGDVAMKAAIQAQIVNDKTPLNQRYGGFSGRAVAQLVGILANSSSQFNYTDDVQQASNALRTKVKQLTRALYPLRDVFKQDMKAMVDAVQGLSGMSISQLSTVNVARLSTQITNASRYSGLAPATMYALGGNISKLVAANGGTNFDKLGGRSAGIYASYLLAPGNAPWGMPLQEYQARTQDAIASGLSSQGADLVAMAYGLYKDKTKNPMSITEFNSAIRRSNKSPLAAAMQIAGIKSTAQLYRGRQYQGYSEYKTSGAGAQIAIQGVYRQQLQRFTQRALNQRNVDYSASDVQAAYNMISRFSHTQLKRFSQNPIEFLKLAQKKGQIIPPGVKKVLMTEVQDPRSRLLQIAERYADTKQMDNFQRVNAQLTRMFQDVETSSPSTNFQNFFQLVTRGTWKQGANGILDIGKNKKVSQDMLLYISSNLLGQNVKNTKDARARFLAFRKAFGEDTGRILTFAFMGGGKGDERLRKALKIIASQKHPRQPSSQYKQAKEYINREAAIGGNTAIKDMMSVYDKYRYYRKTPKDAVNQKAGTAKLAQENKSIDISKQDLSDEQRNEIQDALDKYEKAISSNTPEQNRREREKVRSKLTLIQKGRILRKRGVQIFGADNKDLAAFAEVLRKMKENPQISEQQAISAAGKKISLQRFRQMDATFNNVIDGRFDSQSMLNATLQEILAFLRKVAKGDSNG